MRKTAGNFREGFRVCQAYTSDPSFTGKSRKRVFPEPSCESGQDDSCQSRAGAEPARLPTGAGPEAGEGRGPAA
eukprot:5765154-Pyramimonas_sp.AAC.1